MKKKLLISLIIFIISTWLTSPARSNTRGSISTSALDDDAIVCMNIGISAELTGLDNIQLTTSDVNGSAGALFTGSDEFNLLSNAAVSVLVSGNALSNGPHQILTDFSIDGSLFQIDTPVGLTHDQSHQLEIKAVLGNISSQLAGHYQTEVTLTVIPLYGAAGGCGQRRFEYPSKTTWATLAYEDLYPYPGDADYNDMVVNFKIEEIYNASQQLENINLQFVPIARGAGYNHSLKLDLDGVIEKSRNINYQSDAPFSGDAEVKVTYTNLINGNNTIKYYNESDDIVLFSNTRNAIGGFANVFNNGEVYAPKTMTTVSISLSDPDQNPYVENNSPFYFNYRPYLHVNNTGKDIDLYQVNPTDGMIDNKGYPFGLLVPDTWSWPTERSNIDQVYPYFSEYRAWLSGETTELSTQAQYWYNYIAPGYEDNVFDRSTIDESRWE